MGAHDRTLLMRPLSRIGSLSLISTAIAVAAVAQSDSIVPVDPVVVAETPLVADAAGTSRVQLDPSTPIQQNSITSVADNVANLHVSASGAGSFGGLFSLRGLVNTPYFSDPSVTLYFDDLPLGNAFTYPTELFGFASATVARGPQPTLAGRTGEGGIIQFISPTPSNTATGSLRLAMGNFDARRAAFDVRSAQAGSTDAMVAGAYSQRRGYIENTQLHQTVDDQRVINTSARVRVRPSANSEITLQVLANTHRDGSQPLVPLNGPLFSVARGREGSTDSDFFAEALKFAFETSIGRLSATTSHTWWNLDPYDNRLVLPPTLDSRLSQKQAGWNEELRLSSPDRALTTWHLGAWFSALQTDGKVNRAIPGLFPIEASTYTLRSKTSAGFGDVAFRVTGEWRLIAALRYEEVSRDFDRGQTVPAPGQYSARRTFQSVLPKLSAEHAIDRDTHLTLAVGAGTKPGGWSAYTDKSTLARFAAENVTSFEAGIDTALDYRKVILAVRVFDYEIRNYQIERSFNATDYLVVNAPRARSTGGEFEASWHPVKPLTVTGTVGFTDTTLRDFTDPFTGKNYAGHRAPYVPGYDAHLAIAYHAANGLFTAFDATAIGRTFYDESENPAFAPASHVTGNAQLGYETSRWSLTGYVENLADVRYASLVIPGIDHQVPGVPRTYGVEVARKW